MIRVAEIVLALIGLWLLALALRARHKHALQPGAIDRNASQVAAGIARKHHTRLKALLIGLALCFAAYAALALFLAYQREFGRDGLVLAVIISVLPLPIWIVLIQWAHRFKSQPTRTLIAVFIWGATGAAFFASLINDRVVLFLVSYYGREGLALGAVL